MTGCRPPDSVITHNGSLHAMVAKIALEHICCNQGSYVWHMLPTHVTSPLLLNKTTPVLYFCRTRLLIFICL